MEKDLFKFIRRDLQFIKWSANTTPMPDSWREMLVNWMFVVGNNHKFMVSTIHSAIALLDYCVSRCYVVPEKLQLLAICCLWLLTKLEEKSGIFFVSDIVELCLDIYTKTQILEMECFILESCEWNCKFTTLYDWFYLQNFTKNNDLSSYMACLLYLCC